MLFKGVTSEILRHFGQISVWKWVEYLLIALLAVLCARLFRVVEMPVEPIGASQNIKAAPMNASRIFAQFDPFFRNQPSGTGVITGLQLGLFGTRMDDATGRGSAIIAGPDGVQNSYSVGDVIIPGVILAAVGFDNITLDRGGVKEQLFLDQSTPATNSDIVKPEGQPISAQSLRDGVRFVPRSDAGRLTGIVLNPAGDGTAFRAAGFQSGDILVAANGQNIGDFGDPARVADLIKPGASIFISVERGSDIFPLSLVIANP